MVAGDGGYGYGGAVVVVRWQAAKGGGGKT